jgi:hypothetical protein
MREMVMEGAEGEGGVEEGSRAAQRLLQSSRGSSWSRGMADKGAVKTAQQL